MLALLGWSGSDLFSQMGSKPSDKYSHWKMVMAVGLVMGVHALYLLFTGTPLSPRDIITYLPASFLYILAMIFGYVGPVSYTHLDVYKRQRAGRADRRGPGR